MRQLGRLLPGAIAAALLALAPATAVAAPAWQAPEKLSAQVGPFALDGSGTAAMTSAPYPWRYAFRPLGGPVGGSTDYGPGLDNGPYGPMITSNAAGDMFAFNAYYPGVGYRAPGTSSFTLSQTRDSSNHAYTAVDIAVHSSGAAVGLFNGSNGTTYVAYRAPGAASQFDLDHKITCCTEASSGAGTSGQLIGYDPSGGVIVVYSSPAGSFHLYQTYAPPGGSFGTPTPIPVTDTSDVCCVYAKGPDGTAAVGWVRVSSQNSNGDGIVVATRSPGQSFGTPQVVRSVTGNIDDYVNSLALAAGTDGTVAAAWERGYTDTTNCFSTSGGNYGYETAFEGPGTTTIGASGSGAHKWPARSRSDGLAISGHTVLLITEADNATTNDACVNNSANETRDLTASFTTLGLGPGPGSSAIVATTGVDGQGNYRWPQLGAIAFGPGGQALITYLSYDGSAQPKPYLRAYEDRSNLGGGGSGGGGSGGSGGSGNGGSGNGGSGNGGSGTGGNGSGTNASPPKPPGSLVLRGPIQVVQLKFIPLSFQCGDLACYVDALLLSHPFGAADAGAAKLVVAGRWKGKVSAHARRTIRVQLGRAAAKALARRGRLKVTVVINVRAGSRRQTITRSTTIVLKRH